MKFTPCLLWAARARKVNPRKVKLVCWYLSFRSLSLQYTIFVLPRCSSYTEAE